MTYSPNSGFTPDGPRQRGNRGPEQWHTFGAPSGGGGDEGERTRTVLITILVCVAMAVVLGAIMLFRPGPHLTEVTPAPSGSQSTTAQESAQPSAEATATVTVTVPASPSAKSSSSSAKPSTSSAQWPPTDAAACGDKVAANSVTSCGFAEEVQKVFASSGAGTYDVKSPTTGRTYSMTCTKAEAGIATCSGGDNAKVYIKA
ncbi:hypothetical protein [Propionimicrobium sp. PCR01-08-3]|uniref:hypothetical protein n=1 Tax=Propionimicrobium sp. PCR01-08-3 TaxID=3052086 RepID=UPI00255C2C73|nr:hypothetical protein [Propionimicrobium sp. PCR01-08-3]WIY82320.1 hypothetical protein QQ658_12555 [Propionimicrobium sp. PCR01-08-3]